MLTPPARGTSYVDGETGPLPPERPDLVPPPRLGFAPALADPPVLARDRPRARDPPLAPAAPVSIIGCPPPA